MPITFAATGVRALPTSTAFLPADRLVTPNWQNAGMVTQGGIPNRTTIYTTLSPSGGDDTTAIQTALSACPAGQVVLLNAGTFLINTAGAPLLISTGITLRGSGAGTTIIKKNTGQAVPRTGTPIGGTSTIYTPVVQSGLDNYPIIHVAPSAFPGPDWTTGYTNLAADGIKGSYSITVVDGSLFTVGRFVLLDELSVQSYGPTPRGFLNNNTNGTEGTVQVLSGDRVTWNIHNPNQTFQDDGAGIYGLFSRADPAGGDGSTWTDGRVINEIKEIAGINGNVITFTSPLTITYRVSHTAQLTRYSASGSHSTGYSIHTTGTGVENLTVYLSGGGGIFFNTVAYCWAKNVEVDSCFGLGIAMINCFRIEVRDSYVHTSAQPTPAADSYAICLQSGSSECLIENNIMRDYCKVVAFRACGAGSVVGYNYTDDGWDWYNAGATQDAATATFMECGINASHLAGSHHVLFEGNYSFNFDSDYTHGSSIYHTVFRNQLSGKRASFTESAGSARCGGAAMFSWYMSFVGNILGRSGQMAGWNYTDSRMGCDGSGNNCVNNSPSSGWNNSLLWGNNAIWKIGYDPERWPCNPDLQSLNTMIRDGNYDFLNNAQRWHNTPATFAIPNSMYKFSKPGFFTSNPWPWVDSVTGALYTLPAKKRYDDGTPNTVP